MAFKIYNNNLSIDEAIELLDEFEVNSSNYTDKIYEPKAGEMYMFFSENDDKLRNDN